MIDDSLREATKNASNFDEVLDGILRVLKEARRKYDRLGYVSGVISSDGQEHVKENKKILIMRTDKLRMSHDFPIFCSPDIFTDDLYEKLENPTEPDFLNLWNEALGSELVTDVFFTPRWQVSKGAKEEYEIAKKLGLEIHVD